MKRTHTLDLSGTTKKTITRGTLSLDAKRRMLALRMKLSIPIANATGGSVTLSDAQKQELLDLFYFSLNYGADGQHKPYELEPGSRIHREARFCFGSEIEGYTDATDGLAKPLPDGATTTVKFYLPLPTGKAWFLPAAQQKLLGVGPTQAKTIQLEVECKGLQIAANLTISGTVIVEVFPETDTAEFDQWVTIPHFRKTDSVADEVELQAGFPLRIVERSAAHAASVLTQIGLKIGDEVIHESVSPQETITEYNDNAYANAAGSLVDRETVLYALEPNKVDMKSAPGGVPSFRQFKKDLSTVQLGLLFLPYLDLKAVESALQFAADTSKKKVKAIGISATQGMTLPDRVDEATGFVFVHEDDPAYAKYPGREREPAASTTTINMPAHLVAAASKLRMSLKDSPNAQVQLDKQIAAAVPGKAVDTISRVASFIK